MRDPSDGGFVGLAHPQYARADILTQPFQALALGKQPAVHALKSVFGTRPIWTLWNPRGIDSTAAGGHPWHPLGIGTYRPGHFDT